MLACEAIIVSFMATNFHVDGRIIISGAPSQPLLLVSLYHTQWLYHKTVTIPLSFILCYTSLTEYEPSGQGEIPYRR